MNRLKIVIWLQATVIAILMVSFYCMWSACGLLPMVGTAESDTVRFALLQYCTTGYNQRDTERQVVKKIEFAFKQGAKYVLLPEYTFIRYDKQREAVADAKSLDASRVVQVIKRLAQTHSGYIVFNHLLREGEKVYNATIVVDSSGVVNHIHYKTILSRGDKKMGLCAGERFENAKVTHGELGFIICRSARDIFSYMSHVTSECRTNNLPFESNITNLMTLATTTFDKSQMVIIQLAHAGRILPSGLGRNDIDFVWDSPELYVEMAQHWAMYSKSYVALVNKGGPEQPNALYAGQSCVIAPNGRIIGTAGYAPGMLLVDLPLQSDGVLDTTTERLYQTVVYDIPFPRKIVK